MNHHLEHLTDELRSAGRKSTQKRQSILQVLNENRDRHLSAEEIYEILMARSEEIGIATIYRTLNLFVGLNILNKVDFDDGRNRYELVHRQRNCHYHLICLKCGQIIEANGDILGHLEEAVDQENGFLVLSHGVKFYGYCQRCRDINEK